jgi:hypothetical protein
VTRPLVLTARCDSRSPSHAHIGVWQNHGKAGVLTVDAEQEQAVVAVLNSATATYAACQAFLARYNNDLVSAELLFGDVAKQAAAALHLPENVP